MVLMNCLQGSDGDVDGENGLVDTGKEGEGGKNCESSTETFLMCKIRQLVGICCLMQGAYI